MTSESHPNVDLISRTLENSSKKCKSLSAYLDLAFDFYCENTSITPLQKRNEIFTLLEVLSKTTPKNVLEIGTANGGTLFLLCKVSSKDAKIISIDLPEGPFGGKMYPDWKIQLYEKFALHGQKIHLLRSDSHEEETKIKCQKILADEHLDFLLIDGDHSFDGVKKDFEMYQPLVRNGGIIAFHDVSDGPKENVGGVGKFWKEIKKKYDGIEIIDNTDDEGYGIGLILNSKEKNSSRRLEILQIIYKNQKRIITGLESQIKNSKMDLIKHPLTALLTLYSERSDLQQAFPEVTQGQFQSIVNWAQNVVSGKIEEEVISNQYLSKYSEWFEKYSKNNAQEIEIKNNLENRLKDADNKFEFLLKEKVNLVKSSEHLEKERNSLIKSNELFEKERNSLIKSNEHLEEERDVQVKSIEHLEKERINLVKSNEHLEEERDVQVKSIEHLEKERINLVKSNEHLEEERDVQVKSIEHLEKERINLVKSNEHLEEERDVQVKSIEHLEKERINLVKSNEHLEKERINLVKSNEHLEGERDDLTNINLNLNSKIDDLDKQIDQNQKTINSITFDITQHQKELDLIKSSIGFKTIRFFGSKVDKISRKKKVLKDIEATISASKTTIKQEGINAFASHAKEKIKRGELLLHSQSYNSTSLHPSPKISNKPFEFIDETKSLKPKFSASVIIPTNSGEIQIKNLIEKINSQMGFKNLKIILVNSGSDPFQDLAKFANVTILPIKPEEFSHGKVRNLGMEQSHGEYVFFISDDALPTSRHIFYDMCEVCAKDEKIAATSVRQIPKSDSDLMAIFSLNEYYQSLDLSEDRIVFTDEFSKLDPIQRRRTSQIDDVCSCYRFDILSKYQFGKVKYAEDLEIGSRLIQDGYKISQLFSKGIIHSHKRPALYYLKRHFVENKVLSELLGYHKFDYKQHGILSFQDFADHIWSLYDSINLSVDHLKENNVSDISQVFKTLKKELSKNSTVKTDSKSSDKSLESLFQKFPKPSSTPKNQFLLDDFQNSLSHFQAFLKNTYPNISGIEIDFYDTLYKLFAVIIGDRLGGFSQEFKDISDKEFEKVTMILEGGV